MKLDSAVLICCLLCSQSACATVSEEAVVLSSVVSRRIAEMQASHEAFVAGYFGVTRERMEDFLAQQWMPEFLTRFMQDATGEGTSLEEYLAALTPLPDDQTRRLTEAFTDAGIADTTAAMDAVRRVLGAGRRGESVIQFAQTALDTIRARRSVLIDPIDEFERHTLTELRNAYAQIQRAQSAVSGHLRSLREVQEEQDRVLEEVGLLEARDDVINGAIDANEQITRLLNLGVRAEDTFEEVKAKIGDIMSSRTPSGDSPGGGGSREPD